LNDTITYNSIGQLIEPDPIRYSFNTPGWYVVLGLFFLIAIIIGIFQYRKYKKNAYRREAVRKIESIAQQKSEKLVYEINSLLKSIAIQLFGRKKVAALFGTEWFGFLQSKLKTKPVLTEQNFEEFTKAMYTKDVQIKEDTVKELVEFAINWVKNHKVNV